MRVLVGCRGRDLVLLVGERIVRRLSGENRSKSKSKSKSVDFDLVYPLEMNGSRERVRVKSIYETTKLR